MSNLMCPYCGEAGFNWCHLIPEHQAPDSFDSCPGTGQIPRNAESDRRPLWNGSPAPAVLRESE